MPAARVRMRASDVKSFQQRISSVGMNRRSIQILPCIFEEARTASRVRPSVKCEPGQAPLT